MASALGLVSSLRPLLSEFSDKFSEGTDAVSEKFSEVSEEPAEKVRGEEKKKKPTVDDDGVPALVAWQVYKSIKVSHPLSIRLLPSQLLHTQLFRCVTRPRPPPFSVTILRRAARGCRALSWRAPHKGGCAGGGRGDGWRWRHLGCPHCRHFIARQPRGGRRQVS